MEQELISNMRSLGECLEKIVLPTNWGFYEPPQWISTADGTIATPSGVKVFEVLDINGIRNGNFIFYLVYKDYKYGVEVRLPLSSEELSEKLDAAKSEFSSHLVGINA